jgi:deazaflavin-dependent oxidoreductase (nitroreductase family)
MTEWADRPNVIARTVRRVIATRPAAWLLARTIHHVDGATLRLSGGRTTASAVLSGLPIIELTTTGAKSGRPRTVPLVGIPDGERLILIASNWGQAKHPAWYYNVKANPAVTTCDGVTRDGVARPYVCAPRGDGRRASGVLGAGGGAIPWVSGVCGAGGEGDTGGGGIESD